MTNTYIMAVTADEYELPLSPPLRTMELARFLGIDASNMSKDINNPGRRKHHKRRYVKVELDEDE